MPGFSDPAVREKAMQTRLAKKKAAEIVEGKSKPQAAGAIARWSAETATEVEVEAFFRTVDTEEGLSLLAKMRRNSEIASRALNARLAPDDTTAKCETCGGGRKGNKPWALTRPKRDERTGLIVNQYFCSIYCVSMENHKVQGVKGVADRGMVREDNPKNHPGQV